MALNICGATWLDRADPCAYGDSDTHECWNDATCTGSHMCMCEATPPAPPLEFDAAYSAVTGESTGDYVPTISTADGRTLEADFGSLGPEWHALTGHRSFGLGGGNADPIFEPAETATDAQIREWVRDAGGDVFAIVSVITEDPDSDGGDFGTDVAGWAVIYRMAGE
jgi:hypothetical protein